MSIGGLIMKVVPDGLQVSATKQNLASAVRQTLNDPLSFLKQVGSVLKIPDFLESDSVDVWIGYQKKSNIHLRFLEFSTPLKKDGQSIEEIFAAIILRCRDITKNVFNSIHSSNSPEEYIDACKPLSLEGSYQFTDQYYDLDERQVKIVPLNTIVFYLDSQTTWRVVANLPDLQVKTPTPFINILKQNYKDFYPQEVYDFAFADPKNPLRVYTVEEKNGHEIFHFELLFKNDDEDKILKLPLAPIETLV